MNENDKKRVGGRVYIAKSDYYTFSNYKAPYPHSRRFRTLRDAKRAYWQELQAGDRLSCCIFGNTNKDDSISLTFTPFYSDTHTFGRTQTTYIGEKVKRGEYQFN